MCKNLLNADSLEQKLDVDIFEFLLPLFCRTVTRNKKRYLNAKCAIKQVITMATVFRIKLKMYSLPISAL